MEQLIVNPIIPYSGPIPGGLQQGKSVRIKGVAAYKGDRFFINLCAGAFNCDIGLHISVRLNQGYIARNSFQDGIWGTEQHHGGMPIRKGEQFEIVILAEPNTYMISINGKYFCHFSYRIPREFITYLKINGDVLISVIAWGGVENPVTEKPAVEPLIAYNEPIPGGLQQGKMVQIRGVAALYGDRFNINLSTGPQDYCDVGLHISVRLNQGYVARNSYRDGHWEAEEEHGGFPIPKGQPFKIVILVEAKEYRISINEKHFCYFPYRIPTNRITYLNVKGDASINLISWGRVENSTQRPAIVDPPIPYNEPIPGNLQQGKIVRIKGVASPDGDRFNINLSTGLNICDIGLHISVRLNQGYVARNSYQNGRWEAEQGKGGLPIQKGQKFEITVLVETKEYVILINGKHFCNFPHRISRDRITHLNIKGDVWISHISWEGGLAFADSAGGYDAPSSRRPGAPTGSYDPPPPYYDYRPPQQPETSVKLPSLPATTLGLLNLLATEQRPSYPPYTN